MLMLSPLMYGFRSTHAFELQYFAESSGPASIAASGAVPLLMACWMFCGVLLPTCFTVIHGYCWWNMSSTCWYLSNSGFV